MTNKRFNPNNTDEEIILAMAGDSPNAIVACTQLLKYARDTTSEHGFGDVLDTFVALDRLGIQNDRLAILWEICGYNVAKMIAVFKACQLGLAGMSERVLKRAIDRVIVNLDAGIDLDAVVSAVQEHLPRFNPSVT